MIAFDAFIAHATRDSALASQLASALEARGLRIFLFSTWSERPSDLEHALEASRHGIVVLSPFTMTEPWVSEAYQVLLNKAVLLQRRVIPVLAGEGDPPMPLFLSTRRPVDLRGATEEEVEQGLESLARALRRP